MFFKVRLKVVKIFVVALLNPEYENLQIINIGFLGSFSTRSVQLKRCIILFHTNWKLREKNIQLHWMSKNTLWPPKKVWHKTEDELKSWPRWKHILQTTAAKLRSATCIKIFTKTRGQFNSIYHPISTSLQMEQVSTKCAANWNQVASKKMSVW